MPAKGQLGSNVTQLAYSLLITSTKSMNPALMRRPSGITNFGPR